jgi:uncharacterized protein (TIGR00288 family)
VTPAVIIVVRHQIRIEAVSDRQASHASVDGRVALLIDFENLVRGMAGEDSIDCELLFRLAEDYGRVLLANAYADWRMKDVNQYQTDLYRLGADLVHVFGKRSGNGFKNAVDVKMAVDAIGTISALPHIDVFVIVSGDRDFIHVLKALRQHGKTIIGVAPSTSSSDDFAALCDRFVKFDSLAAAYDVTPSLVATSAIGGDTVDLDAVRHALAAILANRPEGIKGALVKPMLRRELSPTFDESAFGFSRLTDLLRQLDDTVAVVAHEGGGDVTVYPAASRMDADAGSPKPTVQELMRLANLRFYKFDQHESRRRERLRRLHDIMLRKQPFRWEDVQQQMLAEHGETDEALTVTVLSRTQNVLYQGRAFSFESAEDDLPMKQKLMRLNAALDSPEAFIRGYESSIIYKVGAAAGGAAELSPREVAEVLGLPWNNGDCHAYCRALLDSARRTAGTPLARPE